MTVIQSREQLRISIPDTFSTIDPLSDTELLKIAQDVFQGLQYSFLAAAMSQDKAFAPDSIEENFRLAIGTRNPEKRAGYQSIASATAAQTTAERQLSFGRYATLSVEEYGQKGFAATRLPALELDAVKLVAAVKQIQALPLTRTLAQPVAAPSPIHTFGGGTPPATVKSLGFYITEVRCVDETNGAFGSEAGHDEIQIGGMAIDEAGNTIKIKPFDVNNTKGDFDEDDNPVVSYPFPGKAFYQFDTTKTSAWPKNYAAFVYLAEIDNGGFASALTDAWQKAAPLIKQKIEDALIAAGTAVGGALGSAEIGAVIGKVLGKILGWVLDKLIEWIISWFQDDIFAPGTALINLQTAAGTAYVNSPGWNNLSSPEGKFTFTGHGGIYTVKCRWLVDVPGLIASPPAPVSPRHYVGVFRAGNDPYAFWVGDWNSFQTKWDELSKAGLRLVDLETFVDGNKRLYAGVFRAGADAYALWAGVEWDNFKAKWQELSKQGLRLINLQTYLDGGKRLYAGVFRAGTNPYSLWVGMDWQAFTAKWDAESKKGLRLIDLSSYSEGGKQLFNGVFGSGTDGYALYASDWSGFTAKWDELSKNGLRLISLESYTENGKRFFAGVFRAGSGGYILWDSDWNGFIAKWKEVSQGGLRLVDIASY
ncbi:hypothetical protein [Nostoc sp. CALU 1950]|uniref:hypothetical protein n=1 Tax=Nostoc sp. CALU 1950 TaxID=3104321 RepID=UPI003EB83CC1